MTPTIEINSEFTALGRVPSSKLDNSWNPNTNNSGRLDKSFSREVVDDDDVREGLEFEFECGREYELRTESSWVVSSSPNGGVLPQLNVKRNKESSGSVNGVVIC
ncbi:unnamed protein product [Ambrosiozyma monospora]|uniref:Unnamed protein product n=1 Tax=Ambrosiozyma monospora TaxID=43982 RepID=A0ACB5U4D8_AMBMO|nr:unnamed protein product [Ambrosiozyma monospora]